jgi:succinate dehydrogenase flavin-adding protein (antitoxin of CptAB toxin-antitoxin module)
MISLFTFDTGYEAYLSQYLIENIVLQNYLNLTCDLTTEEREEFINFVEEDDPSLPVMIYSKKEKVSESSKESHFRVFDRREYRAELKGVKGYIRKLPLGATASDEAIANAKRLGIELRTNETFVTEFIKKVYKKN